MSDPVQLLERARRVAVIGCSATPGKDAHEVPRYMLDHVEVLPVNPTASEIFGRKAYAALDAVPGEIDIVNVFRPASEAPAIVQAAIAKGAKAVWLQTGIESAEAKKLAEDAGLGYVENACMRVVMRLILGRREREANERLLDRLRENV